MDYRYFNSFDEATSQNLHRLDHLSKQSYSVSPEMLQGFIESVIRTHGMLPKALKRYVLVDRCFVGDRHWHMNQKDRDSLWSDIRQDLDTGLSQILADDGLKVDYIAGVDRPATRGERILALCEEFNSTFDHDDVAQKLFREASGTAVGGDVKALQRLLRRKRIADMDAYNYEVQRHIAHIQAVAHHLHHLS